MNIGILIGPKVFVERSRAICNLLHKGILALDEAKGQGRISLYGTTGTHAESAGRH